LMLWTHASLHNFDQSNLVYFGDKKGCCPHELLVGFYSSRSICNATSLELSGDVSLRRLLQSDLLWPCVGCLSIFGSLGLWSNIVICFW
jgi:hypothetical protein